MIVKKRITNSSSVKGALFFVHNLRWVCSCRGEKKTKNKKQKSGKKKTKSKQRI